MVKRVLNFWNKLAMGLLVFGMLTVPASATEMSQTTYAVDMNSTLSYDIRGLLSQKCPTYTLQQWEKITKDVQVAALNYNLTAGLLLSLMEAEDVYASFPQTRLYYYNLDNGQYAESESFPEAWTDSERVARSYRTQIDRYQKPELAVAAYFVGSQGVPAGSTVASLSENLRDIITLTLKLDAEYSHLGERNGPQIVETTPDTPVTSYEPIVRDYNAIERAYINNMMVFNSHLDEESAKEIFNAISTYSEEYPEVDARLVMALVGAESSFRPEVTSHAGAQGLGQLMPYTAAGFGITDPFNIDQNISGTFQYLAREINRWEGQSYPIDRILAAYNAGAGAVEKYDGIPPYEETMNYVPKVVSYYFAFLPENEREARLSGMTRYYESMVEQYRSRV